MKQKSETYTIHIHDFAGHPFQAELSNQLSDMGFEVFHSYFKHSGVEKGKFEDINENGNIHFLPIQLNQKYDNQNLINRFYFELKLAFKLIYTHRRCNPAITIIANTPLISAVLFKIFIGKSKFILWHQDVFSRAIRVKLKASRRFILIKKLIVRMIDVLERWLVNHSDWVICISDSFLELYRSWEVDLNKVSVIENWAPLEQIDYSGTSEFDIHQPKFIYAGTLGMKHNPQLLIDFIQGLSSEACKPYLTVISEGLGADYIRKRAPKEISIEVIGFLPLNDLNQKLAESNIAIVLLEEDASTFSVPSKAYTYLSAGKCVFSFAPEDNAASKAILNAGSFVFSPNSEGVRLAIKQMKLINQSWMKSIEIASRNFALSKFDVRKKAESFRAIIYSVS